MSRKKSSILVVAIGLALLSLALIAPLPKASAPCGEEIVLDWRGRASLFVLGFAALLWATEALPVAFTGLVAVVLLPLLGAMQWDQAVRAGLTSDVIPFLVGIKITSEATRVFGARRQDVAGFRPRRQSIRRLLYSAACDRPCFPCALATCRLRQLYTP